MKLLMQQGRQHADGSWHAFWRQARQPLTLEGRSDTVELICLAAGRAHVERGGWKQALNPGDFLLAGLLGARTAVVPAAAGCRLLHIRLSAELLLGLPQGGRLLAMLYAACEGEIIGPHSPWAQAMLEAAESLALQQEREGSDGQGGRQLLQYAKLAELLGYLYEGLSRERFSAGQQEGGYRAAAENLLDAVAYMIEHVTGDLDMRAVIRRSGLGRTQFYEEFRLLTGMSPKQLIHRLRIRMAIRLLRTSDLSVTSIAYECGYRSLNYFHKHFKEQYAVTPREYRNRDRLKRSASSASSSGPRAMETGKAAAAGRGLEFLAYTGFIDQRNAKQPV
ncbi:helix-turn-helix transcriptional regulator [Cohnella hongkongensis]|uniref:Helix-turn-helix transcriptional regulator n=1 Tax=Cohnella hongkongensis TaxID=178337 RepID=A0ABV9FIE4_9BACL